MPAPSETWADFAIEDLLPNGPLSASLVDQIRTNQIHLKEVAYGTGSGYTGGTAHDHDGTDSDAVSQCIHENLLLVSCPGRNYQAELQGGSVAWTASGFAPTPDRLSNAGMLFGGDASGETLYQTLGGLGTGESIGMVGTNSTDGIDCVASFFIRPAGEAFAAGALEFGFADGVVNAFTSSATMSYTDHGSKWARVFARFTGAGAGHATDVRFLVRVTTGYTGGFAITGLQINRGRNLAPWTISNVEGKSAKQGNVNYTDMPECPVLDFNLSMRDAIDVT